MVADGQFREDLFYRLRVLNVDMPPLRERKDDILMLAWHFLRKISEGTGTDKRLDPRTEQLFLAYNWPGNVRELQSVIQSLVTLAETEIIAPADLPSYMRESASAPREVSRTEQSLTRAVEALEKACWLRLWPKRAAPTRPPVAWASASLRWCGKRKNTVSTPRARHGTPGSEKNPARRKMRLP